MGVAISRYSELGSNELLTRFCSKEVISPNDPFWNQMLAYNITPPATSEEQLMFDSATEALLQTFLQNNLQTGNLGSLLQVFVTRASILLASPNSDNVMLAWQTYNALLVVRCVTKYLVEMVAEHELCRHLEAAPARARHTHPSLDSIEVLDASQVAESPAGSGDVSPSSSALEAGPKLLAGESRVEMLIDALISLVVDVPITDNTYYLHLECINTILVLMSVYMFAGVHGQTRLIESSLIYRTLYQGRYSMHAPLLVKTLLNNLASMLAAPPNMFGARTQGGSILIDLASSMWNMISFTSPARRTIYTHPPLERASLLSRLQTEHPIANQSCLLLLTLHNHCITADNLYRKAVHSTEDNSETSSTTPSRETDAVGLQITPPRVDLAALHKALCATAGCEHSTLLLYIMLHSCRAYKRYVTTVPNIEDLIIPILQTLYNAPDSSSHHIYMSLIVILILTEDDSLIKSVHNIMLKNLTWYTERAISEISLGGLMVLVIIRALQYNMARGRDKYLHTNCAAAIANMSCEFRNLHPYVAQRLISLFETLTKRRNRLCAQIEGGDINQVELPHQQEEKTEEVMDHIAVLDEVIRMLLEIINSCVTHQLGSNLNVVYALLHKRKLFADPRHQPQAQNIEMVIGYFSSRLQRVQEGAGGELGVTEVLACIKKGAEQWSSDRLKKFPDLKFKYVEEERPEEFFTPYVWALSSSCGGVHWASEGGARALHHLLAL